MKQIIKAVNKKHLVNELTPDKLIRKTNNADNELYVFTAHNAPYLMQELGRIRETTFRNAGGGTGKEIDIDHFDTNIPPYQQLIVWDPAEKEIVGGYRFIECRTAKKNNIYNIATSNLYDFSEIFTKTYLPYTIELGRSFVQPMYQSTNQSRKGLYALDNLWDGLGYLVKEKPQIKYFFGKVTMYNSYNRTARDILLAFLYHYFPLKQNLITAKKASFNLSEKSKLLDNFLLNNYEEDYKKLQALLKENGETIPPLINSYMKISPSMMTMGTTLNESFGDVEETAILITIDDIYPQKKERHLSF